MTASLEFKTNLNCGSCVAAVKPFLDNIPQITDWHVDTAATDRTLTVRGETVSPDSVREAVAQAGFHAESRDVTGHKSHVQVEAAEVAVQVTYFPLLLLGAYLVGVVGVLELQTGSWNSMRAMRNFMGAFFLTFSFFKMLDLRGFADSYRMYDIMARRFPRFAYVYPFIELMLGVGYITGFQPVIVNFASLLVMSVSSVGVVQSLLQKRKIRCACLGSVFNLPMSTVTLIEDGLMMAMAIATLLGAGH